MGIPIFFSPNEFLRLVSDVLEVLRRTPPRPRYLLVPPVVGGEEAAAKAHLVFRVDVENVSSRKKMYYNIFQKIIIKTFLWGNHLLFAPGLGEHRHVVRVEEPLVLVPLAHGASPAAESPRLPRRAPLPPPGLEGVHRAPPELALGRGEVRAETVVSQMRSNINFNFK